MVVGNLQSTTGQQFEQPEPNGSWFVRIFGGSVRINWGLRRAIRTLAAIITFPQVRGLTSAMSSEAGLNRDRKSVV